MTRRGLRKLVADWYALTIQNRDAIRHRLQDRRTFEAMVQAGRAYDLRVEVDRERNAARASAS